MTEVLQVTGQPHLDKVILPEHDHELTSEQSNVFEIERLPFELLQTVLEDLDTARDLLAVTQINKHLRDSGISNPKLWASPDLSCSPELVKLFLRRSESVPLRFRVPVTVISRLDVSNIVQTILAELPRTEYLEIPLIHPSPQSSAFISILKTPAPSLRALHLSCALCHIGSAKRKAAPYSLLHDRDCLSTAVCFPEPHLFGQLSPSLIEIDFRIPLSSSHFECIRQSLGNLVHLTLLSCQTGTKFSPGLKILLTMLQQASHLETLFLGGCFPDGNPGEVLPTTTLHKLREIGLCDASDEQICEFIRYLQMPKLKTVNINSTQPVHPESMVSGFEYLRTISCSLQNPISRLQLRLETVREGGRWSHIAVLNTTAISGVGRRCPQTLSASSMWTNNSEYESRPILDNILEVTTECFNLSSLDILMVEAIQYTVAIELEDILPRSIQTSWLTSLHASGSFVPPILFILCGEGAVQVPFPSLEHLYLEEVDIVDSGSEYILILALEYRAGLGRLIKSLVLKSCLKIKDPFLTRLQELLPQGVTVLDGEGSGCPLLGCA
ncbi:hypothetical protein VNI00_013515 [Paramarasmius palmivorus]|uniref:F-box domain-containing protein n=1 Tax=Paramarasmius palmivorus TaxID=297713 RepID=A0AAW0BWF9_9AGAR